MRKSQVSKEQFAIWSFERDKSAGEYPNINSWSDLPEKDKDMYLSEAAYYMSGKCPLGWPDDIMERLKES